MNMILAINMEMIGLSIAIFLGIILVLVIVLLVAKNYLSPSGPVKVTLNGEKDIEVASGGTLLGSLSNQVFKDRKKYLQDYFVKHLFVRICFFKGKFGDRYAC